MRGQGWVSGCRAADLPHLTGTSLGEGIYFKRRVISGLLVLNWHLLALFTIRDTHH